MKKNKKGQNLDPFAPGTMNDLGQEVPNPVPVSIILPAAPMTNTEKMKKLIREEFSRVAAEHGEETFEQANDFDVDDPFEVPDPITKYELMHEEYLQPATLPEAGAPPSDPPPEDAKESPPPSPPAGGGGRFRPPRTQLVVPLLVAALRLSRRARLALHLR